MSRSWSWRNPDGTGAEIRRRLGVAAAVGVLAAEAAWVSGGLWWVWGALLLGVLIATAWAPAPAQRAVAMAAGLIVYVGAISAPLHGLRAVSAGIAVAALLIMHRHRRGLVLPLVAAITSVAAVAIVLTITGWRAQAASLAVAGTALLIACGFTWAVGATYAHLRPTATGPLANGGRDRQLDDPLVTVQGWTLVLTAAALSFGEGMAFSAAGLLAASMALRWRVFVRVGWGGLNDRDSLALWALAIAWLTAGLVAVLLAGQGLLDPGELGRVAPLVLVPLTYFAARTLPALWRRRAATVFIAFICLACGVATIQVLFNLGGDSPVMAPLAYFSAGAQTRVPGMPDHAVAGGFYFHRLKLAHVLVLGIGLLIARQLFAEPSRRRRLVELAALGLCSLTLLLTYARAALLGAAAGALALTLVTQARWRRRALGGLVLVVAIALVVPGMRARVLSIGSALASAERARIWSQGVDIIGDYPLGVGLSNYPTLVKRYYDDGPTRTHLPPHHYGHNLLISAWAETGPVGAVCYLLIFCLLAWVSWRRLARGPPPPSPARVAAGALLFAAASFWVIGLTHDVLYHKPVALAFAALVGLSLAEISASESPEASQ